MKTPPAIARSDPGGEYTHLLILESHGVVRRRYDDGIERVGPSGR